MLREIRKYQPKWYGTTNQEITFSESSQGNYAKDLRGFATPINCDNGFTGGRGNILDWVIGTIQPLCFTC